MQRFSANLQPFSRSLSLSRAWPLAFFAGLAWHSTCPAATPSAAAALSLKPIQGDAIFEEVEAAAVDRCRVEDIEDDAITGWEVIGPEGLILRRFIDSNADKKVDLWCYYQYGVETYRDVDANFNGKADQYRWLGTAGTRWGLDEDEDGKIDSWKQISPEEVSAEVISSLRTADSPRFARLLVTGSELKTLGLGKEKMESLSAKASRAAKDFSTLASRQKAVGEKARWIQFAASPPGVVPSGTNGSTSDVVVYENAVAMFEQQDRSNQLIIGTLIQVGNMWRLVDLPMISNEGEPLAQASGNFFTPGGSAIRSELQGSGMGMKAQELVTELEAVDRQLASASTPAELEKLHDRRTTLVEELVKSSSDPTDRDTWARQLVDTVSMAIQSGNYPSGLGRLKQIATKLGSDNESLGAYADYQTVAAEYVTRQMAPDVELAKVQEWYVESLTDFVDRYPKTAEAGQAMLQLALSKEFEDKEREALGYYQKVAASFPNTDAGEKAAGAVRRLDSIGKVVDLQGQTLDGKSLKLSQLRGKPVVLHYWATWCEPCKQDMKMLRRLQSQYAKAGLQLVGVNVDVTPNMATSFLKENPLPWPQMFDNGGLESSSLAMQFGVQTLPTMMLIDGDGKLVRHNVRMAELDAELDKMVSGK